MKSKKKQDVNEFDVQLGSKEWSDDQLAKVKAFVKTHSEKRTPERKLKNDILSIKYQMEEYVNKENSEINDLITIDSFLSAYLKTLDLTFKKFALAIDTTDGNLKKYLSGDRSFNTDLALKFSHFFHTSPDLWMKVNIKNEFLTLQREKKQISKYRKYDYEKVLA